MAIKTNFNFQSNFSFNGKQYNSIEDMPEDVKKYFLDQNNNGLPDFVDIKMPKIAKMIKNTKQYKITSLTNNHEIEQKDNKIDNIQTLNNINENPIKQNNSVIFLLPVILIIILILYLLLK